MKNKNIPSWFYELFHTIAIKHNLNDELSEYYLSETKKMYFELINDIESGNDNFEEIILKSLSNHSIGNLNITDKDEMIKTLNGAQFLFISEFYEELYTSTLKEVEKNNEPLPEHDYKSETQKIAWLCELGVLELVLNKCKDGQTFNWRRAANIISSFTDMNPETIRKCLQAIYQPNETNKKNNPLGSPNNNIFVEEMRAKFKLNKEP